VCQINVIHVDRNKVGCGHTCGQTGTLIERVRSETQGKEFFTQKNSRQGQEILSPIINFVKIRQK